MAQPKRAADSCGDRSREALAPGRHRACRRSAFAADTGETPYLMPQVLTGSTTAWRVMREETFGPVVGHHAGGGDEEAVRLMNDSAFGLTASIWTRDLERGRAIGTAIEAGTVFTNRCDYLDPLLAWTGVKDTGRGASLGRYGFEAVTRPKSLHLRSA